MKTIFSEEGRFCFSITLNNSTKALQLGREGGPVSNKIHDGTDLKVIVTFTVTYSSPFIFTYVYSYSFKGKKKTSNQLSLLEGKSGAVLNSCFKMDGGLFPLYFLLQPQVF